MSDMQAGFARRSITPPLGTRMMGFGARDVPKGCQSIHDDIYCRALYMAQGNERAVIVSFDMCFIGKEDAFRLKGALGTALGLEARQILLNSSHSHAGPASGRWYAGDFMPLDRPWLYELDRAVLEAVHEAIKSARPVRVLGGATRSGLPMNRRRPGPDGVYVTGPNPKGTVCDLLPILQLLDAAGKTVCLLFSVSVHPSAYGTWEISAEYPGVATQCLDAHLGGAVSMFVQGCGGDAKMSPCGRGRDRFRPNHWPDVVESGEMVAREVIDQLQAGLSPIAPALRCVLTTIRWPLAPALPRSEYQRIAESSDPIKKQWAQRQLQLLERNGQLPQHWPIIMQGMQIGRDARIVALEGEPMGAFGLAIARHYPIGVTFPLGYTNGEGAYLVTSGMLNEGGMEPTSYWEYGLPSPLAPGTEAVLDAALLELDASGIR